jgi:putative ABC transport system permease protein
MHMALANPSTEQIERLHTLDYVRDIGISHRVGLTTDPFFDVWYVDEENWTACQTPTFTNVIGHYAREENEIMISRAKLTYMGIEEPYIGMEITLPFAAITREQFFEMPQDVIGETKTFIVSAIYTEFVSQRGAAFTPLFVSRAFAEKQEQINQENKMAHIIFTNQSRALEYAERLVHDLPINEGQNYGTHPALGERDMGVNYIVVAVGIIALFMMATGFLLIYNVMYISVSKDVRFYGLLKTLGTTPRQLKRIVNTQILRMYVISLPIGLIVAAILSFAIVPAFIGYIDTGTVVSFSPYIYIGGAVFTLLTAYVGAFTSARKAAKVSPVEAVRYTGEHSLNVAVRSSAKGKLYRMAWRNVFRERKRAFLVLISLFLGITVFTTTMTLVYSQDIDGSIDSWRVHDIDLSSFHLGEDEFGMLGMDREIIDQIAEIPGVKEVREDTLTDTWLVYNDAFAPYVDWLMLESPSSVFFQQEPRDVLEENLLWSIRGIDSALIKELTADFDTPVDIDAFERGEVAFLDSNWMEGWQYPEDIINLLQTDVDIEIGEARHPLRVEIIGQLDFWPGTGIGVSSGDTVRIFMSNRYLEERFGRRAVFHLGIITEQGMDGAIYRQIEEMIAGAEIVVASSYAARLAMEEAGRTTFIMGVSISGILALIGLFNFINVVSVGLLVRKRELAALESVGMSNRQIRSMLRLEGVIYWGLTILISISLGTVATYGLFSLVHNQDPMQYPEFIYPLLPVLVGFGIIMIICSVMPELMYRSISKMTLVERLREAE